MMVTYTVDKNKVLNEFRRLTAYVGSRKQGDKDAYLRISATESDNDILEQFWKAACSAATDVLMHFSSSVEDNVEGDSPSYKVVMEMSSLYDTTLNESIEDSLQNFFVNLIASKWYKITSPDDEAKYAAEALGYMNDVERKIYHRKRPRR